MNLNDINYIQYGIENKIDMVLLHGWGQNISMMKPLGDAFKKIFKVTIIDLPGFGKSIEPNNPMEIEEYTDIIHKLFEKLKIKNPILIGHSFGGRISLIYASKYKTKKLILLSTPYKKRVNKPTLKSKILKMAKGIIKNDKFTEWAKSNIGSTDYKNASPIMRQILVKTVNTDLTENAKKIDCPTLLICGELDKAVPINESKELETIIKNVGIVIYPNQDHYAYLNNLSQTISVLDKFLYKESREKNEN